MVISVHTQILLHLTGLVFQKHLLRSWAAGGSSVKQTHLTVVTAAGGTQKQEALKLPSEFVAVPVALFLPPPLFFRTHAVFKSTPSSK